MKNDLEIGIVGFGILGKALNHVFENKFKIYIYDKFQEEHQDLDSLIKNADLAFVNVPTPMKETGQIDLSCVNNSLKTISSKSKNYGKNLITVLRSTIVPGTTEKLQSKYENLKLVFNPEFLTEKNYLQDMENTNRVVLGSEDKESLMLVEKVYKKVFPNANYLLTNSRTAEIIKYASNVTLAGQIALANEIYQICQKIGVDYNTVKDTILLDKRIGTNISVPGTDGSLGFGGKCFPKDLNAFIFFAKSKGYNPNLLEEIWETNLRLRNDHDWDKIKGATTKNGFK